MVRYPTESNHTMELSQEKSLNLVKVVKAPPPNRPSRVGHRRVLRCAGRTSDGNPARCLRACLICIPRARFGPLGVSRGWSGSTRGCQAARGALRRVGEFARETQQIVPDLPLASSWGLGIWREKKITTPTLQKTGITKSHMDTQCRINVS